MTGLLRHPIVLLVLGSALVACSRRHETTANKAPQAQVTDNAEPAGAYDPNDPKHGTRKLMNLDAPVYVDGVEAGTLRYGDLVIAPASLLEGGTPEFSVYDYVKSIGVAPESIKSVHLHGNNDRIASIEGSELLKEKGRFTFTFASGTTGAAIQRWDTTGLKNTFVVHEIRRISIFVKKEPVAIHPRRRCHLDANGACTDAIPYAEAPGIHSTRIYVDGKMVGFVKRRQIADSVIMGKDDAGDYKYNVAKLVESLGVKSDGIKAVELVAGDDVVSRAADGQFARFAPDLYFVLPKHNHGKIRVHVPGELAKDSPRDARDALVSSIHVFKARTPRDRALAAISEDTDLSVQLASNSDDARDGLGNRHGQSAERETR